MSSGKIQGLKATPDGLFTRWDASEDPSDLLLPPESFIICDTPEQGRTHLLGRNQKEEGAPEDWQRPDLPTRYDTYARNRPPFFEFTTPTFLRENTTIWGLETYSKKVGPILLRSAGYVSVEEGLRQDSNFHQSDLVCRAIPCPGDTRTDVNWCLVWVDEKKARARRTRALNAGKRKIQAEEKKKKEAARLSALAERQKATDQFYQNVSWFLSEEVWKSKVMTVFQKTAGSGRITTWQGWSSYYRDMDPEPIQVLKEALEGWEWVCRVTGSDKAVHPLGRPAGRKLLRSGVRLRKMFGTEDDTVSRKSRKGREALKWFFERLDEAYPSGRVPKERTKKPKTPAR